MVFVLFDIVLFKLTAKLQQICWLRIIWLVKNNSATVYLIFFGDHWVLSS